MFARSMRSQVRPGAADQLLQIWAEDVMPAARSQSGFRGATLLLDREANVGISITRWDSREELEAGEKNGFLGDQLAKLAPHLASAPERQVYEIVYEEVAASAAAGAR